MSTEGTLRPVTTLRLAEMKSRGEKITMLTAYDYTMARILDRAGIDVILVGDSAANVMAGYETTVPMTLDNMIYHAQSVTRAVKRALVLVDLPFGTYQGNSKEALCSAVRIMKETEAGAVKLEGGKEILESVDRILSGGIWASRRSRSTNTGPTTCGPKRRPKRRNSSRTPTCWKRRGVSASSSKRYRRNWPGASPPNSPFRSSE